MTGPDTPLFARREDGGMTIFGIFCFVMCCMLGSLAFDVAQLMAARTQLQAAADAAAHAAIYYRGEALSAEEAREKAIAVARTNMPQSTYGDVLRPENILFGRWNATTNAFEVDPTDAVSEAVFVRTDRLSENGNSVGALLMQFVGITEFDVVTASVFEGYVHECHKEGFVAQGIVDVQSNNSYLNGFCVYSAAHVELNQNNYFEDGTVVAMPDKDDVVLPRSGYEKNVGLADALTSSVVSTRILARLDEIYENFDNPNSRHYRDYITNFVPKRITGKKPTAADFEPGRVHELWCGAGAWLDGAPLTDVRTVAQKDGSGTTGGGTTGGGTTVSDPGKATLPGETLRKIVLITDCQIKFTAGAALEDVMILNFNGSATSFSAPSGLRLGLDDGCDEDGGAQLVTWGGVDVAAGLEMYGSQIIAAGDIEFAANADGIQGAAMVAGGRIDGTSNMTFGYCGTGMDDNFDALSFRMRG